MISKRQTLDTLKPLEAIFPKAKALINKKVCRHALIRDGKLFKFKIKTFKIIKNMILY